MKDYIDFFGKNYSVNDEKMLRYLKISGKDDMEKLEKILYIRKLYLIKLLMHRYRRKRGPKSDSKTHKNGQKNQERYANN